MKTIKLIIFTFVLCSLHSGICIAQWVQMNSGMGNISVYALAYSGNNIFAGTQSNGVYLSTNNGTSWTQTSLNNQTVKSLAVNGNYIFAGISNYPNPSYGVYLSTNNGTTWSQTSLNNQAVGSLAVNGNNIFAGTYLYGVYLSSDNGTSWTQTGLNESVWSLTVNGNNIFAGTNVPGNGVYLSTDNCSTWTQTSLNNRSVYSLIANGNNIFAGTSGNGIYVTSDNGISWIQRNEGLGGTTGYSFSILNNFIFAGTNVGVYRRPLGELTSVQSISNEVPNKFSLSQNYPNPFNPSTKIKFALPINSFTKLVVYDVLGREMETLVNEQLNAGTYEAVWSADKFSSGVYYYKLTVGDPSLRSGQGFSQTNKMILLK